MSRQDYYQAQKYEKPSKLFITNLPPEIPEEQLKTQLEPMFQKFGPIKNTNVKRHKSGQYSYSFLQFERTEDALRAIEEMDQKVLHDRPMKVRQDRQGDGCFTCKKSGHFAKECPMRDEAIRDSREGRREERDIRDTRGTRDIRENREDRRRRSSRSRDRNSGYERQYRSRRERERKSRSRSSEYRDRGQKRYRRERSRNRERERSRSKQYSPYDEYRGSRDVHRRKYRLRSPRSPRSPSSDSYQRRRYRSRRDYSREQRRQARDYRRRSRSRSDSYERRGGR